MKDKKVMMYTDIDKINFENATNCFVCEKPLFFDKVKNHLHLDGKIREASHSACNLKYKFGIYTSNFL